MGVEGLLDQSEIKLLLPPGAARHDPEAFANVGPFAANQYAHWEDAYSIVNKVRAACCVLRAACCVVTAPATGPP